MFKQKIFLSLFFILPLAGVKAQSVSPEVVTTSGGYFTSPNAQLSWTLGETVIETWTGISATLTQGFQQNQHYLTGIEDLDKNISVNIYPNPSSARVNVQIKDAQHDYTDLIITDLKGNQVHQAALSGLSQLSIDISQYAAGSYFISINNRQSKKQTLTLIKQ